MTRRVTLVAGTGSLVPHIATAIQRRGDEIQVIDIIGGRQLPGLEAAFRPLADVPALLASIEEFGPSDLALAGGVHISEQERRSIALHMGPGGSGVGGMGDLGLATTIGHYCQKKGIRLLDVPGVAPELVAPEGHIAGPALDAQLQPVAAYGLSVARAIGAIDLGQSVVVSAQRPIAAEDAGGTDALLSRIAELRRRGLVGGEQGPLVLGKSRKPGQPSFFDLPSIGSDTVVNAAAAGVSAIVVEAGGTLILDRAAVERAAESHGIPVVGLRHV